MEINDDQIYPNIAFIFKKQYIWLTQFKSNFFPIRLFINEDVVTCVYKDGKVIMVPQDLMTPEEQAKIVEIRKEVEKSSQMAQGMANSMLESMRNPFDFVNKALSGFFAG